MHLFSEKIDGDMEGTWQGSSLLQFQSGADIHQCKGFSRIDFRFESVGADGIPVILIIILAYRPGNYHRIPGR